MVVNQCQFFVFNAIMSSFEICDHIFNANSLVRVMQMIFQIRGGKKFKGLVFGVLSLLVMLCSIFC
jgi:hypothetical protein